MRRKSSRVIVLLALAAGFIGGAPTQALAQQQPEQPGATEAAPDQQPEQQQQQQVPAQDEAGANASDANASDANASDSDGEEADVDTRYKAMTRQAAEAYSAKDYGRALELFEQAYELKPVPNLRYNMGRVEEKRGNFDEAMSHYEEFVTLPGVDIKARQDALDRLKTLREVVALRREGEEVDESTIDEKHDERELASANEVDEPGAEPARVEHDYTAAWVTMGLAAASFGTSGFFALQARQANDDFENASTRAARRSAASSGETSSIVADSMLGLGAVMTGLSVYFFLSPSHTETATESAAEAAPAQTTMQLAPQIGQDGAGMTFSLEF